MNNIIKDNWNIIEEKVIKPMYEDGSFPLTVADAITKELNPHPQLSNDEIKKTIDVLTKWYLKNAIIPDEDAMYFDKAIQVLEQQLNGGWISVSEKLPPLGACVICTVREHFRNQFELRYPVYYLQKTYENGYAFYFGDTNNPLLPDISEVVAWMPIPMPYEGGYQNANKN